MIIVAGAGIGGLAAALALAQAGLPVLVLERAAALEEVGAGIQLTPNASRILLGLGLGPALEGAAAAPAGMDVRSGRTGAVLAEADLGAALLARHGAPWWVVHRGDLQSVLAAAVRAEPGIVLEMDAAVEHVEASEGRVAVTAAGRSGRRTHLGAALVGADGLWSTVRRALGSAAAPAYAGRRAWRCVLPMADVPQGVAPDRLGLWLGPGAHLVHYPIRAGAALNVVAIVSDQAEAPGWNGAGAREAFLGRYAGWAAPAGRLIEAGRSWSWWSLAERAVDFGPGRGPVTLLGDAAHPMLPFLAQGGAMAIEDAAVLARACTARPDDLAAAFRAYENARRARVAAVQREARRNGRIYHLAGPAGLARDAAIRLMGGRHMLSRYDWIYRFRA